MILLGGAIVVALVIGYATGGRLHHLEGMRLRWWGLAIGGLLLQLAPFPSSWNHNVGIAALLISFAMLIAFAWLNRRWAGVPVILFGLCLNALVIGVNQGMPVTREALVNSGQGNLLGDLRAHGGAKHHLAHHDTLLALGDVIGIPKPIGQAVSVGDIFVYAGMIWAIAAGMRERSPSATPERSPGTAPARPPEPATPLTPQEGAATPHPGRPPPTNRGTTPRS
jgi:Family of unknown function (DUF5317)